MKKRFHPAWETALILAMGLLVVENGLADSPRYNLRPDEVVSIQGKWEGAGPVTGIEPHELRIPRYTTVFFFNESETGIRVRFGTEDEEGCRELGSAAMSWRMNPHECLRTRDVITPSRGFRVRFDETGNYEYTVEYVGKNRSDKAVIHVRSEPDSM